MEIKSEKQKRKVQNVPNTQNTQKVQKIENYSEIELVALVYALKGINKEEDALSVPELAEKMRFLLGAGYNDKMLSRHLPDIIRVQNECMDNNNDPQKKRECLQRNLAMQAILSGTIQTCEASSVRERRKENAGSKRQTRYYFLPCLDDAFSSMLKGSIYANPFLYEEEKEYLLTRLEILNLDGKEYQSELDEDGTATYGDIIDIEKFRKKPQDYYFEEKPGQSNIFLRNVFVLYFAIQNHLQIEITYGTYDKDPNMDEIWYHERYQKDTEEPRIYRLNPYELLWSNGKYYLIASFVSGNKKSDVLPMHFRVDRIVQISVGENVPAFQIKQLGVLKGRQNREAIPKRLKEFYDENGTFLAEKYTSRYPNLRLSYERELITMKVRCVTATLQVLVDAFGNDFVVKAAGKQYGPDEVLVEVKDVDFENARDFCLANPVYITPVEPRKLVTAVKENLQKAVERLTDSND